MQQFVSFRTLVLGRKWRKTGIKSKEFRHAHLAKCFGCWQLTRGSQQSNHTCKAPVYECHLDIERFPVPKSAQSSAHCEPGLISISRSPYRDHTLSLTSTTTEVQSHMRTSVQTHWTEQYVVFNHKNCLVRSSLICMLFPLELHQSRSVKNKVQATTRVLNYWADPIIDRQGRDLGFTHPGVSICSDARRLLLSS